MKHLLWLVPIAVLASGCGSKPVEPAAKPGLTSNAPPGASGKPISNSGGKDIAPTTMAPLPNAPIVGGDGIGEGGGNVSQAVKNKAKDVASSQGASSSLGNPTGNDDQQQDDGHDDGHGDQGN